MEIGEPERTITIEPIKEPVPQKEPVPERENEPDREPEKVPA